MTRSILYLTILATLAIAACSETNPIAQIPQANAYSISGKLRFDKQIEIPSTARVVVAWNDSNGSAYVYGEGAVNMADSTFKLTFNDTPPSDALTPEGLGVGFIFLTSNPSVTERRYTGMADDSLLTHGFLGGAGNHAVIYLKASADSLGLQESWAPRFQSGYNTGRGIRMNHGHDDFEKVEPTTIELIINDADEIDWLNWT